MPKPWLKMWSSSLDKEKVAQLSGDQFKFWVYLLWIALRHDKEGELPDMKSVAFQARIPIEQAARSVEEQVSLGLVEKRQKRYVVHDWKHWQGDALTDAERKQRQRDKGKNSHVTDHVTCHDDVTYESQPRGRAELRGREGDGEVERETTAVVTSLNPIGHEYQPVGELAIELTGDLSWGAWVLAQGRFGHPAWWIELAIKQASGAGKLEKPYVAAILKGWAGKGGPPAQKNGPLNHVAAKPTERDPELEENWRKMSLEPGEDGYIGPN